MGRRLLLILGLWALAAGCETLTVPMTPQVERMSLPIHLPADAALLVTEETKGYVFSGKPESFTGSSRIHRFPLGEALESASRQAFSQVFQQVTIVRTPAEAKAHRLVIEPRVAEFHFRYDALRYVGFAAATLSRVRLRVTVARGDQVVWDRTVESPEQRRGPFLREDDREKGAGEAASAALVAALTQIASEAAVNPAVRHAVRP